MPHYHLKVKHPLYFFVNCFQLVTQQYKPRPSGSHYEIYGQFQLHKGSQHVQSPNRHFSLSAKMNGTERRTLVSP